MKTPQLHTLKLGKDFAEAKLDGRKPFEIRKNDRDFKVGDIVKYTCPEDKGYDLLLHDLLFCIVYITNYEQQLGYIVFAEKQLFCQ